jgi:hypothetical protein
VISLVALIGCSRTPRCDEAVDSLLEELAGTDGTYCGTAEETDDPVRVDECAVEAFLNGEPFEAKYEWSDIDTAGTDAWASDGATV